MCDVHNAKFSPNASMDRNLPFEVCINFVRATDFIAILLLYMELQFLLFILLSLLLFLLLYVVPPQVVLL